MIINRNEGENDRKNSLVANNKLWVVIAIMTLSLLLGLVFLKLIGYSPSSITDKVSNETVSFFSEVKSVLKFKLFASPLVPSNDQAATGQKIEFQQTAINGPLKVHPQNPRYFTDNSGKAILLTGSHYWLNLQDGVYPDPPPAFDYSAWLDFLEEHNHNFFRLWVWEQARWTVESPDDYFFTPLPYMRTGPGLALDGKPKFDLNRFNQAHFDRIRARVIEAGEKNMYVSVMLFNGWSIESSKGQYALNNPWRGHPFNGSNNINGIDGDTNNNNSGEEVHQDVVPEITALQKAYVQKVIDSVNDLDNVLYEIVNESNNNSIQWQYEMINHIKDYEKTLPKQHPVGMTVAWPGGVNDEVFVSPADWVSINNQDGTYMDSPPVTDGEKVSIYDTDHLCGICGDRYWVWKSFTRGHNPIFMDQYDDSYKLNGGGYDTNNPNDVSLRRNMGYVREYGNRMNLAAMQPLPNLASTGYILANPNGGSAEYLVYLPTGGQVSVDLSGASGNLAIEWLNPENGNIYFTGTTTGGGNKTFKPPFSGDAVLYLYSSNNNETRSYIPLIRKSVPTPIPPAGQTFVETFNGQPNTPTAWRPASWDVQVHSRDIDTWLELEAMQAGHGQSCEPPPANHAHSQVYEDGVFLCRDHVMTAIKAGGYGVIYLTPNQMIDFSSGEGVVKFDVSTLRTSGRDWIDIWITPYADNLALPLDLDVDLMGAPKNSLHITMDFGDKGVFKGSIYRNFTPSALPIATLQSYDDVLTPSAQVRSTFELRISRTHVKFGMPKYNLWWIDTKITDLGWDRGVIQLGHHSYNPEKDCEYSGLVCKANTWHWDNVSISPAVPFSMIKADRRYVLNRDADHTVTFDSPAPANAFLRFSGVGTIEVSLNGGTFQKATKALSSELPGIGDYHPEHMSNYWMSIPQGTQKVELRFSDDGWYTTGLEMIAKDFVIWK